jgi:hypothetical protein
MLPDPLCDPFGEASSMQFSRRVHLLGGQFNFDSNSRQLMDLVASAYAGLPRHRLSAQVPEFRVRLLSMFAATHRKRLEPAPLTMLCGGGLLSGAAPRSNFVAISPRAQGAVVVVGSDMLKFPYHTRYELIEFTVFTLAARAQGLVPLHAACVGRGGRGLLLMGASGAGKSTVALHALLRGFDFLAEDSVFIAPATLLATGIANFLHLRADSLRWLKGTPIDAAVRNSAIIRRRSGVKKFEYDLRQAGHRLADSALRIDGIVFLSPEPALQRPLLRSLTKADVARRLREQQAYAATQASWQTFNDNLLGIDAFELRRGRHPAESVDCLGDLLSPERAALELSNHQRKRL